MAVGTAASTAFGRTRTRLQQLLSPARLRVQALASSTRQLPSRLLRALVLALIALFLLLAQLRQLLPWRQQRLGYRARQQQSPQQAASQRQPSRLWMRVLRLLRRLLSPLRDIASQLAHQQSQPRRLLAQLASESQWQAQRSLDRLARLHQRFVLLKRRARSVLQAASAQSASVLQMLPQALRQAAASLHPRILSSRHLQRSQQHQPSQSLAASFILALRQSRRLLASAYQAVRNGSLSPTHQRPTRSSQRPAPATPQHQLHLLHSLRRAVQALATQNNQLHRLTGKRRHRN
jgi:hypothetical protein